MIDGLEDIINMAVRSFRLFMTDSIRAASCDGDVQDIIYWLSWQAWVIFKCSV